MARLTDKQINQEIKIKGFEVVDLTQYKNLKSPIMIKCGQNHIFETNFSNIRRDTFKCPVCYGGEVNLAAYPLEKKGLRIIALDNSTQKVGLAIFDDEDLVYYKLLSFTGSFEERLLKISDYLEEVIINEWDPDVLVFEDVQFQNNYNTYKKLAMLLGVLIVNSMKYGIDNEVISSNSWRQNYQISKDRTKAKEEAIQLVKTMYNIEVNDDVAEAILLGRYMSEQIVRQKALKKAF